MNVRRCIGELHCVADRGSKMVADGAGRPTGLQLLANLATLTVISGPRVLELPSISGLLITRYLREERGGNALRSGHVRSSVCPCVRVFGLGNYWTDKNESWSGCCAKAN